VIVDDVCLIDGFGPVPVLAPASVGELGELVRRAAGEGKALYPLGGRTMLDVGLPPRREGYAVDLRGLSQVVDYPARDMTVTVRAGITVAELGRLLAGERQRLPVDVPRGEEATLGGALAVNASGPRRYGFGTLRDYVIGLSWVDDEGDEVKAGGRVVKNVAGYDLCKLHVGALGTLGVLTQVTLKVRPLPQTQVLLAFGCAAGQLGDALDRLHASRTRPAVVDLLNGAGARACAGLAGVALPEAPWVVAVGFEDSEEAVTWQLRRLIVELGPLRPAGLQAHVGAAGGSLWRALAELTAWPEALLTFKANVLPGEVASFALRADALPEGLLLHAQAGSGVVRGHGAGDLTPGRAAAMLKGLAETATSAGGNLVVPRCPAGWKGELPIWGAPRGDSWLMRRVKEQLDPRGLFNPGRFVDGI
jgi:glycolate oxidase FAD binding subunit